MKSPGTKPLQVLISYQTCHLRNWGSIHGIWPVLEEIRTILLDKYNEKNRSEKQQNSCHVVTEGVANLTCFLMDGSSIWLLYCYCKD